MQGTLRVTPAKLREASDQFSTANNNLKTLTQQMLDEINGLRGSWSGDAADQYTSKFSKLQVDMNKMSAMIQEHVNDLQEMASEYENAENSNMQTTSELADTVIS